MADRMVMIASDGILDNGKGHPRAAGTYTRVLGAYVREQHVLTLMDAMRKMTLCRRTLGRSKAKGASRWAPMRTWRFSMRRE